MESPEQNKKKNKAGFIIILLLISVAFNIYQWSTHSTTVTSFEQRVDTLVIERVNVEKELADTKTELNRYQGISASMDTLLKEANDKIAVFEKNVKSLTSKQKMTASLNNELRAQLADLQSLRDEYLTRIDSLLTANKQLTEEKTHLKGTVETLSKNLESTVNTASVLKTEYFNITSFKRKSSGKFVETSLAKRTHKLNVCFDVLDNKIAKTGDRTVYLKITEPGGKVVGNRSEGSSSVKLADGEELLYTASNTITYTGTKQNVCTSYEEQKDKMFPPGTYLIEAYIDGKLAGASSYVLK